jgi:hypothetical protein
MVRTKKPKAVASETLGPPLTEQDRRRLVEEAVAKKKRLPKYVWDAPLREALETKAGTPNDVCTKWLKLAPWGAKLSRGTPEREVFTLRDAEPIAVAWFDDFRLLTAALPRVFLDARVGLDVIAAHRLLQDLDEVRDGKALDVTAHVREVDVLVRAAHSRIEAPQQPPQRGLSKRARKTMQRQAAVREILADDPKKIDKEVAAELEKRGIHCHRTTVISDREELGL